MALLSEERPKDEEVELEIAREEAGKLYRALERQFTDEEEVINILTGHGTAMLAEIATLYTRVRWFSSIGADILNCADQRL